MLPAIGSFMILLTFKEDLELSLPTRLGRQDRVNDPGISMVIM